MSFIDAPANFYIGRRYDPAADAVLKDEAIYYDSRDLTTHGLVLGMTGSGKTGLCITLLEEAILDGIPAIIVDPKGDITNLLLTFPDLNPAEFEPWIDEDEARRKGNDVPTHAAGKADLWKNGLADWGITPERMVKLRDAADYTIYTPGSTSGVPVSILASLRAPRGGFEGNEEALREQISGMVTAILSLAGISAEPVKDPEHVLISNIIEHNWRAGKDLSLADIIMQVQEPPFDKLGVLPLDRYIPEKDRFALAMALNNVVASPSFSAWMEGVPMDIQSLLYTPEGKPRVAIMYTAHLNDTERMFVMTLVLETLLTWMRNQSGTSSLRALLYIDEIFGYFPPVQNPPSKQPLMRLLKQARAFGLGVLMATQNPVDLDYKGLSNIGTWFIGRLQSEGDADRILAGLKEAAASGDMNLAAVKQLIASIKSRVFLLRNVHDEGATTLLHSRWAMNYLAGPLTRQQIEGLMAAQRAALSAAPAPTAPTATAAPAATAAAVPAAAGEELPRGFQRTKPATSGVDEYYLPVNVRPADAIRAWEEQYRSRADNPDAALLAYEPVLLAQVSVRYDDRKSGIRVDRDFAFHIRDLDNSGFVEWDEYQATPVDRRDFDSTARGEAIFGEIPVAVSDSKRLKTLESDLVDVLYRDHPLEIQHHPAFGVYAHPKDEPSVFEANLRQAAREARDAEVDKATEKMEKELSRLEDRLKTRQRALDKDRAEASGGTVSQLGTVAEGVLGLLSGKRTSTSISKIGRAANQRTKLQAEVAESEAEVAELQAQIQSLTESFEKELVAIQEKWDAELEKVEPYKITPYKKDIQIVVFGLGWVPAWVFSAGERFEFAPAFQKDA
ncbi:MAG: DUF87 domain-containing protein [Anaerolineae bacterium]|nr:DUF87 domain-containing protein [Anaerolineae bacterium]